MALLNRLFRRQREVNREDEEDIWTRHSTEKAGKGKVRVILFRECDRKGRKLLFDSETVERSELAGEDLAIYTEVGEGVGYKYLQPPHRDVKQLGEMIFGSAAVAYQVTNLKIHQLDSCGQMMWSSIFQAPRIRKGGGGEGPASDTSLNSSFGCSIGSESNWTEDMYPPPPDLLAAPRERSSTGSTSDSGFYSSYALSDAQASFTSSIDHEQEGIFNTRRRLSSNADTPDYGSLCSLQRRWLSCVESSLSPNAPHNQSSSHFTVSSQVTSDSFSKKSKSSLSLHGENLKSKGTLSVLGLAIIIQPPDEKTGNMLYKRNLVLEDIYSVLLHTVQQAYIHKKRFVATMWGGWEDAARAVESLYTVLHLASPAWHLAISQGAGVQDKLVQDIISIRKTLDTKETNFFFSSLLTGVLTHHLGWVETVMPSTSGGDNFLHKPGAKGVEQFSKGHWYSPTRLQFRELHGMLGCPVRCAKTLVLADTEEMARKLVFVLSYFVRCSQIFEQDLEQVPYTEDKLKMKNFSISRSEANENFTPRRPSWPPPSYTRCDDPKTKSSPELLGSQALCPLAMKKSHSYICSLADSSDEGEMGGGENCFKGEARVNFLIGENEKLNILTEEEFDNEDSLIVNDNQVIITKAVETTMTAVDEEEEPQYEPEVEIEEEERVEITELPFHPPVVTKTQPASLVSLVCCSDTYLPGTVIQGCHGPFGDQWRARLQSDLLASASCSFTAPLTEEVVCVVGEVASQEVSLVSAQQVVVGRPGLPVPMSPLVASMLDSLVISASLASLPASVVLNQVEDHLQQLYLQSCLLAEYLLSVDLINLQTMASVLDLDPCDIPLLLAVASTHTPMVGQKYGLSFTG